MAKPEPIEVEVRVVPTLVPHPFVSPFRHPVWWWKLRHWRRDLRELERDPLSAALARRFDEELEREVLFGQGRN